MNAITAQQEYTKRELAKLDQVYDIDGLDDWEVAVTKYLADLRLGLALVNKEPETEKEKLEQFQLRRKLVLELVEKVEIKKDREMEVVFKINVLSLLNQSDSTTTDYSVEVSGSNELYENYEAGTCSRRR